MFSTKKKIIILLIFKSVQNENWKGVSIIFKDSEIFSNISESLNDGPSRVCLASSIPNEIAFAVSIALGRQLEKNSNWVLGFLDAKKKPNWIDLLRELFPEHNGSLKNLFLKSIIGLAWLEQLRQWRTHNT